MMKLRKVFAALLLAVLPAAPVFAAPATESDVAASWDQFLAKGDYNKTMAAFDALSKVGYNGDEVDAGLCRQEAASLKSAIDAVPVSLALHRAEYLCADALGDKAGGERALAQLVALSRYALKQGGDPDVGRPISVLSVADAYALLSSSGMEEMYEYYTFMRPARYFPLVLVGWDDEAKVERHLAFDYVDTLQRLKVESPYRGMPIIRNWIANAFLSGGAKGNSLAALDVEAVRAAAATNVVADKLAKLRGAAMAGGHQSAKAWLLVCAFNKGMKDCGDGLVDALLEQAERKRGGGMATLAYAYFEGVGTKRDKSAAWTLLDGAAKRWPNGAVEQFADLWSTVHEGAPLPAELQQQLVKAEEIGSRPAHRFLLRRKAYEKEPQLDAADVAFLSAPEENGRGLGYGVLQDYYNNRKQQKEAWESTSKAAEAGNSDAQASYASALLYGDDELRVKRDAPKGEKFADAAAQGGDAWAAHQMSMRSLRIGDYVAAEGWLLAAGDTGDIDSIMRLAGIYADERPGVSGKLERAVELYRMIAALGPEGAPGRRALADLALKGRGLQKDPVKAMEWLKADANRDDHESQMQLGSYYLRGDFGKVDEPEGDHWMQRAMKGGNEDAYTSYSSWLYYDKNTPQSRAQAIALLKDADAAGNIGASNNYAWVLCTSPLPEIYDPQHGQEVSKRIGDEETMNASALDTVAACYAANGDFKRAVELQTRAAKELATYETPASKADLGSKQPGYERRLEVYKAGKRYEEHDHNQ